MDRKQLLSKKSKGKSHPPPGDFIALGNKPRSGSISDGKHSSSSQPAKSTAGIKRDAPPMPSGSSLLAKKPKLITQTYTPLGRPDAVGRGSPTVQIYQYEELAKEVEGHKLLDAINEAEDDPDNRDEAIEKLICGAVKHLRNNRAKPESGIFLTVMYLAKTRPSFFGSELVIEAFCSLLKRDVSINFKAKGNPLVSVLACNTLMAAFQDDENWPDSFIKVYLEDSLGERVWVDRSDCKAFCENLQSAFNTKISKSSVLSETRPDQPSSGATSPMITGFGDDDEKTTDSTEGSDRPASSLSGTDEAFVFPRYTFQQIGIETHVLDVLKDHLLRRVDSGSRNLLKLMTVTCGYSEVRTMASQRLEMWLQNPKLTRAAQDLLMGVCLNCDQHSQQDVEVMSQLSKIRLKTKPLINHYLLCVRELLSQHPDNLRTLMHHTIYNELSNSRNPNNMSLLSAMFQQTPERSAKILADIFQDLLSNRDDYLRAVRALFREIVRAVRHDINFANFALGLMKERKDSKFKDIEPILKDRLLYSLTDLIALTALMSVTPAVREAALAHSRGDPKEMEVLRNFQNQISIIQRDAVWWLHTVVPTMFDIKPQEYGSCLRKLLFVEKADVYHKLDNWPPEGERSVLLRLVSEVPVLEDTLMRILVIGLSKDLQINAPDALELADQLVKRAAMLYSEGFKVLYVERLGLIDAVLNLCAYRHPENIALPKGYQPPTLAISALYWKAWTMLLVIVAHNPNTFGRSAWENYPMLKCFMEMSMTNNFKFPPPTMATDDKTIDDIKAREKQFHELEKQQILEFETHLAAATTKATITEGTSLLISQLTTMDPNGIPRKPPSQVLEQLRSQNNSLRIGPLLCRSRSPDFLLDVIQRQGPSQSMPWLVELVESSEGSLDVLPVQCLCEFLLHESPEDSRDQDDDDDTKADRQKRKQKLRKQEQLLIRLQTLLHSATSEPQTIIEVLGYFLKRLSSHQVSNRHLAVKGLSMVLEKTHVEDEDVPVVIDDDNPAASILSNHKWLLELLPRLPQFGVVQNQACAALRQAVQIETNSSDVSAYIVFLSQNMDRLQLQEMDELALDMAQLIVERSTLINHLLPTDKESNERSHLVLASVINLFYTYLKKAQQSQSEAYSWSNTQDQILLQWKSGELATMNILVVHSMIILLTFGKPKGESSFDQLLDTWFPEKDNPPTAFLVDTSEEALLLPDWLKLRMIRSIVDRLVDAALQDLEPSQLLLFVQSFGIPVSSMSKLLLCLDQAIRVDLAAMEQVVVDKAYMAQLVEVQHMRGAKGGDVFHNMLIEGLDRPPDDMEVDFVTPLRRKRLASHLTRLPELQISHQDVPQIVGLLDQIFCTELSPRDRHNLFSSLMKHLSKDKRVHATCVVALLNLLSSNKDKTLILGMKKHQKFSGSFLRVLTVGNYSNTEEKNLQNLMQKLGEYFGNGKSTTASVIKNYTARLNKESHRNHVQMKMQSIKGSAEEKFKKVVDQCEKCQSSQCEALINMSMCLSLKQKGTKQRTKTVCKTLKDSSLSDDSSQATAGLLIDWLSLLDPDILAACPDLQQEFLFLKDQVDSDVKSSEKPRSSTQPYLLALLTHHSSWTSLHQCIRLLLGSHDAVKKFKSSSALDFLWASIHIPRIWQGRDRKLPKNHEPEDVLGIGPNEVDVLVHYIIEEATCVIDSENKALTAATDKIDKRMSLLLKCCNKKQHLFKTVVAFIHAELKKDCPHPGLYQHVLLQLYMQVPNLIFGVLQNSTQLLQAAGNTTLGLSKLDAVTHRVLCSLGSAAPGKNAENKMFDANIACRKLAAQHPILVLRQLSMVAALLKGRSQFTFGEMRHRNHLLLYTHILGILELLQPYIFHKEYTVLEEILEAYFELLRNHMPECKQFASIITKYVKLLHSFMQFDGNRSGKMLHRYIPLLKDLASPRGFPEFPALKSIVAGLTLPRKGEEEPEETQEESSSLVSSNSTRPSSPWSLAQLGPFLQRISKGASTQDVLSVLDDLDQTSKRKVDILEHFMGDLKRLLTEQDETCRNTAHSLVMRHVRHNPGCASDFVDTYLHCLESGNQNIVNSALTNLAEFTLLAQEHSPALLQKAFNVGILTNIETKSYITDTVQLLNMETMLY